MHPTPPFAEINEVATCAAPLGTRAVDLLDRLDRWVPSEAAWMALRDPGTGAYAAVGSAGLDQSAREYLRSPPVGDDIAATGLDRRGPPATVADLPVGVDDLPTWAECLTPAGFGDCLALALFEPGGLHVGFLGLLFARGQPPSPGMRDRLGEVAPFIARGVSPIHSVQASARIVKGATAGAVLLRDGQSCSLPGLADHELAAAGSPVLDIARRTLVDGQVYRSFLWPAPAGSSPAASHVRVTVIAATDVPPFVLGALLVTPDSDCLGLTPRELEVLGLVVEGCSNHQIATSLCVAPRTVAAHMEHLLSKLAAPTRTLAAIRAEREGCYVPPAPRD